MELIHIVDFRALFGGFLFLLQRNFLQNEDNETTHLKDILRRKIQEKQQKKAEKSEDLDQLVSSHKDLLATGFSVDI